MGACSAKVWARLLVCWWINSKGLSSSHLPGGWDSSPGLSESVAHGVVSHRTLSAPDLHFKLRITLVIL